ncbi:IpaD/SipD/SspD family type III secretion system needle tip protein [Dyella sp. Tek66A03]|uniref:IpaD/SipD/SspD family type III secretion system needle tip protein n=1 Tax=Dyella sp. Tek66A03 TaxID=3458298 RepID=UPI00403EC4FF
MAEILINSTAQSPRLWYLREAPSSAPLMPAADDLGDGAELAWLQMALECAEQSSAQSEDIRRRYDEQQRRSADAASKGRQRPSALGEFAPALLRSSQSSAGLSGVLRGLIAQADTSEQKLSGIDIAPSSDQVSLRYSHSDFYSDLIDAIDYLDSEWLSKYSDALAQYIEFFREFSNIMALLKDAIEASGDNDVNVNFSEMSNRLKSLIDNYSQASEGLGSFPSQAAADAFIRDLGLSGLTVERALDGSYAVMIDLQPVQDLRKSMPESPSKWDMAKYNAWLSSKDTYTEQLQHVSQVLGEKYSRNTQLFDTLIKVLSSTIESISEADKAFINNL